MKLEQQCVNLELSKKLKEIGAKQESLFYWSNCCSGSTWDIVCSIWHDSETGEWGDCHELKEQKTYSAFTVAELGEMLKDKGELPAWLPGDEGEKWYAITCGTRIAADTEAGARAMLLLSNRGL